MVCEKAGVVILLIKMTAPGFDTEMVEMCFKKMEQCQIFEKQVVNQMIQSSGNAIDFDTRCYPKRR